MNAQACYEAFDHQHRRYKELFWQEMKQHRKPLGNKLAAPKTVLSFAEDLMLCPTEDGVQARIARDLEAARGCYTIAGDVASEVYKLNAAILIQVGQNETPFCLFATVVRLRCEAAIEKFGDSWNPPAT
jgi:hypothetical protein